jgi:hypothetical protein
MAFRSNEEFFQAVADLVAKLERRGRTDAAAELRSGMGYLNGLTDGWALFLESIEKVQAEVELAADERKELGAIGTAVHTAVYRR